MTTNNQSVSNRRRSLKLNLIEFLGGSCVRCGWSEHPAGLVAHHVNPSKKLFGIGSGLTKSWGSVKEEAKKCILLCQNCHSVVHAIKENRYFDESLIPKYEDIIDLHSKRKVGYLSFCVCGGSKSKEANLCKNCFSKKREKISWPATDKLKIMVKESSYVSVAKKLGVSDNAVRKRLRNYGT